MSEQFDLEEYKKKFPWISENMGRCLSARDLTQILPFTEQYIRDNYEDYGGIIRGGRYLFFERSLYNALQGERRPMASRNKEERESFDEILQHEERSQSLGDIRKIRQIKARDEHNIFGGISS